MNAREKSESSGNPVCEFLPHSVACMPGIVPKSDCRIGKVMFVAESAKACYVQHKEFSDKWLEAQPAGSEHAQEMPARKNQHIAFDRAQPTDDTIGSGTDLLWRFSVGATVAKQLPAGPLRTNLRRSKTFVIAVVPFDQIAIELCYCTESGQFTGPNGALQGTRENLGENKSRQPLPKSARIAFAAFRQRQIGKSGMLTCSAPGSLPVTRQIDYRKNFAHRQVSRSGFHKMFTCQLRSSQRCSAFQKNVKANTAPIGRSAVGKSANQRFSSS